MAWIESHQTLREHPKVYVLVDALGVSKAQVLGHLHLLWWWCVDYALDGVISQNDVAIARAAEWPGDAKAFVAALVGAEFLDRADGVLTIHDWLEYCGTLVSKRLERQSQKKTVSARKPKMPERAPTEPNRTEPNQTVPGLKRSGLKVVAVGSGGCGGGNGNDREQNLQVQDLLDRVVEFTGSPQSRAFYQKAVSVLGIGLVEEAVGEARMRAPDSRARYLTTLLTDWMEARRVETR